MDAVNKDLVWWVVAFVMVVFRRYMKVPYA